MPITMQDIREYQEQFGIHDLSAMPTSEYLQALDSGAFVWLDHHEQIRSTFSDEVLATNREQIDALIQRLQEFRERMVTPPDWMSER